MSFSFDHLVHFVDNPQKAIEELQKHNIYSIEGGRHVGRGTFNALSYFDLSYIEYLGTYDRDLVIEQNIFRHSLIESIVDDGFTEGFIRFAIRTENIEEAAKNFAQKGLTVTGPVSFSRTRPDGSVVEWQLLYIGDEVDEVKLPFIIQWKESDEDRRKDLTNRNTIVEQKDLLSFSHLTIAVKDAKKTAGKWANYLGLELGEEFFDEELQSTNQVLKLQGGNIMFSSPLGEGVVSNALMARGEKPIQVTFHGERDETFSLFNGQYKVTSR